MRPSVHVGGAPSPHAARMPLAAACVRRLLVTGFAALANKPDIYGIFNFRGAKVRRRAVVPQMCGA